MALEPRTVQCIAARLRRVPMATFASGLDNAFGSTQAVGVELRTAHTLSVVWKSCRQRRARRARLFDYGELRVVENRTCTACSTTRLVSRRFYAQNSSPSCPKQVLGGYGCEEVLRALGFVVISIQNVSN
jgi:hypothetical protein